MPNRRHHSASAQKAQAGFAILAALSIFGMPNLAFSQTVTTVSPNPIPTGQCVRLTVTGSGFVSGTQVLFNGTPVPTTYSSSTQVLGYVTAEKNFINQPMTVSAMNPGQTLNSLHDTPNPSVTVTATAASSTWSALCPSVASRTIPAGFMGLSHETDAGWIMGSTALGYGINIAYRKLLGYLMDSTNSPFLIRVGGGSTDELTSPPSVDPYNELHAAFPGVTFTLGVPMGKSLTATDSTAVSIAKSYVDSIAPESALDSIEIGNETDNYQYPSNTNSGYTFDHYEGNYTTWTGDIRNDASSNVRFTGPTWAFMRTLVNDSYWSGFKVESPGYLEKFLNDESGVTKTISMHWYAGENPPYNSPSYLLGYPNTAGGPGPLQFKDPNTSAFYYWVPGVMGWAATQTHQKGLSFRVNESNSIVGGGQDGISNSFAAALWAVDYMFELAYAGADGVNFHGGNGGVRSGGTNPVPTYAPWTFNIQKTNGTQYPLIYTLETVNPLYYGLYFFHLSVPDGAQLVPMAVQSPGNVKVWATKDSTGTLRVVVINKDTTWSDNVRISLSGYGSATVLVMKCANGYSGTLQFPNSSATVGTTGITVGGQTWDGSTDGNIQGTQSTTTLSISSDGAYYMKPDPGTATLLTFTPAS